MQYSYSKSLLISSFNLLHISSFKLLHISRFTGNLQLIETRLKNKYFSTYFWSEANMWSLEGIYSYHILLNFSAFFYSLPSIFFISSSLCHILPLPSFILPSLPLSLILPSFPHSLSIFLPSLSPNFAHLTLSLSSTLQVWHKSNLRQFSDHRMGG